jgi:ectoine hydroxylase-related dioxygenase (phytanoyl-CoA dioxygenase family)
LSIDKTVKVFPAAERDAAPAVTAELAVHHEEIARNGYTVIEGALSADACRKLLDAIPDLYRRQAAEIGGEAMLAKMDDEGVIRSPFADDEGFAELLLEKSSSALVAGFLGPKYLLNLQRVVLNKPAKDHATAVWHRDHAYQNFTTSAPVSMTVIFQLDGSNPDNGGLFMLPGSHRFNGFPSDDYVRRNEAPVVCGPGGAVVMDSAVFHRGGQNVTDKTRHSVVQIFTIPLIRQNTNLPHQLGGKFRNHPALARLLGYDNPLPESDLDYRKMRLARYQDPK